MIYKSVSARISELEAYTCSPSAKLTERGGENILCTHGPMGHLREWETEQHSGEEYVHAAENHRADS